MSQKPTQSSSEFKQPNLSELALLQPTSLTRSISRSLAFGEEPLYRSLSQESSPSSESVPNLSSQKSSVRSFGVPSASSSAPKQASKLDDSLFSSFKPVSLADAVSSQPAPIQPPPVPGNYLEPSHHVISRHDPHVLYAAIGQILLLARTTTRNIDFVSFPDQFKYKCTAYSQGELAIPFIARVFLLQSDQNGAKYAIEFQRRKGDSFLFSEIWTMTKQYLQSKNLIESSSKSSSSSSSSSASSMSTSLKRTVPLDEEITDAHVKNTIKCIHQMLASDCADVKVQAISALTKLTVSDSKVQLLLIEEGVVESFLTHTQSSVDDIHRCAVGGLANLTNSRESVCKSVAEKGGIKNICSLAKGSDILQVKRECLRALLSLCTVLGAALYNDQELLDCVRHLASSQDSTIKEKATQLSHILHM